MPRLVYEANELDGHRGEGLEIYVKGFRHDKYIDEEYGSQVFIEVYNGKLRILVWDGSGEDPQHVIEIEPEVK